MDPFCTVEELENISANPSEITALTYGHNLF